MSSRRCETNTGGLDGLILLRRHLRLGGQTEVRAVGTRTQEVENVTFSVAVSVLL